MSCNPELTIYDRSLLAEQLIRQAIESIGGPEAEAPVDLVLPSSPVPPALNLETRRQHAAELLGILPDTLRRERHEGRLLWDVAMEIFRIETE